MSETAAQIVDSMLARLTAFAPSPNGRTLERLVAHLSGAIDGLTGLVDDQWVDELRRLWWPLEYVSASALANDRDTLSDREMQSVESACSELTAFLERY